MFDEADEMPGSEDKKKPFLKRTAQQPPKRGRKKRGSAHHKRGSKK